eukprot:4180097-Alexandrium_andersonii.AAC.1
MSHCKPLGGEQLAKPHIRNHFGPFARTKAMASPTSNNKHNTCLTAYRTARKQSSKQQNNKQKNCNQQNSNKQNTK